MRGKQLWVSGYCNGFAHHWSWIQGPVGTVLSTKHPTNYYHNCIIKLIVRWCVWKVLHMTLKWVAVFSSMTFHINGWHSDMSAPCLYTVIGWGVISCGCGMTFLCGSTLVKVSLLQTGTIAMRTQMFKSNVKPKQTNKNIDMISLCIRVDVWSHPLSILTRSNGIVSNQIPIIKRMSEHQYLMYDISALKMCSVQVLVLVCLYFITP